MVKIDYKRKSYYGNFYNQNVVIDSDMKKEFNEYVKETKERIDNGEVLDWLDEKQAQHNTLKQIQFGLNFLNLTTLAYFERFLTLKKEEHTRLKLDRNTIIQVVR